MTIKNGSLICVAPGQIGGKEDNGERSFIGGRALLFHPDLLRGTSLRKEIESYSFFDYRINEALHMNSAEHRTVVSILRKIEEEIENPADDFQNEILVEYIALLLKFCKRFYHRQFLTRKPANTDILVKFEDLLRTYYSDGSMSHDGLPTVNYCAEKTMHVAELFQRPHKERSERRHLYT